MAQGLTAPPTIFGEMRESFRYQRMGVGLTGSILLLGHGDTIDNDTLIGEPYQVYDMTKAINYLLANPNSPLIKGLLEAYNAGARDIWLIPVAPMSEYKENAGQRLTPDPDLDGQTFYERYYDRLAAAYQKLQDYDFYEVVVPMEAPFYDSGPVDFCTQLGDFCISSFMNTSSVCLGVMGTKVPGQAEFEGETGYSEATISAMIDDPRIDALGDSGKFMMIVVGEGIFMHPQTFITYSRPLDVATAAMMVTTEYGRAMAGTHYANVVSLGFFELTKQNISDLCAAKLNPVSKTAMGKRGLAFEVRLVTDNSLAATDSDFWSINQIRTTAFIANEIRKFGYAFKGTLRPDAFKMSVRDFMESLIRDGIISDFSLQITIETDYRAYVEVGVTPIYGIRNIYFSVQTGPGI